MIRAANHSSYPKVGDSPLDRQILRVLEERERGDATDAEVSAVQDEVTTIVVAEQARAFIEIVTDGQVRWEGPVSHPALHLDGVEPGDEVRWFDTDLNDRQPVVTGPIRRRGPFLVHGYTVASAVGTNPVKVVLPGPVTFARLARDRHYGSLASLAEAVAAAFAGEVSDLAAAGARVFQIDEPLLCRHPEDLDLVAATGRRIFDAAGEDATTILSTYFGNLRNLSGHLHDLPGTHIGLDMVEDRENDALLTDLPEGRGVVLGLFDARTPELEDADDVAGRLAPFADALTGRDVHVGPQAGLALLPRDDAFDKLLQARYLVEKLSREWSWAS